MARNHLYVDNVDLATYGVYISGQGTFSAPEKEVQMYNVPGRDGAVLSSLSRLQNVEVTYPCFVYTNVSTALRNLRSFLLSRNGYVQISDTYHTDEFRLGTYLGPFEPTLTLKNDAASFDLTFNCKPQRYLTSGRIVRTMNVNFPDGETISNPTPFDARPLLRFYGTNTYAAKLTCSDGSEINMWGDANTPYVDIDCETMQVYYGDTNLNAHAYFYYNGILGAGAPKLKAGTNTIVLADAVFGDIYTDGYVSKVEIIPRWWEV